jgi:hypothetical protein
MTWYGIQSRRMTNERLGDGRCAVQVLNKNSQLLIFVDVLVNGEPTCMILVE